MYLLLAGWLAHTTGPSNPSPKFEGEGTGFRQIIVIVDVWQSNKIRFWKGVVGDAQDFQVCMRAHQLGESDSCHRTECT